MSTPWIIDSCASNHMTSQFHLFDSLSPCFGYLKVRITDGSLSPIASKGLVLSKNIELKSILLVPKLPSNLLYVNKLTRDSNYCLKFSLCFRTEVYGP